MSVCCSHAPLATIIYLLVLYLKGSEPEWSNSIFLVFDKLQIENLLLPKKYWRYFVSVSSIMAWPILPRNKQAKADMFQPFEPGLDHFATEKMS